MNGIEACIQINQYLNEEEKRETVSMRSSDNTPFIYALTSEMDEEVLKRIKRAGFKQICKYQRDDASVASHLTLFFCGAQ